MTHKQQESFTEDLTDSGKNKPKHNHPWQLEERIVFPCMIHDDQKVCFPSFQSIFT